jgi:hypothetical protein
MKHALAVLGLLALFAATLPAAAVETDEAAIHDVITRQLDAIKKGDAKTAFDIASPTIQTMFGNAATFMSMVERGYPQIYKSVGHKFLNIDTSAGGLAQRVLIEGEKGSVVVRYEMIDIGGIWRINGCMIEQVQEA